jgi:UDP-2,4-diacetamido-2,4,6-trideoxy-beta-L-altropyranose hydrolase
MKVAFRVDASLQMGTGHLMRCLTLADALKAQGAQCHFISREHAGHLLELIRQSGHIVTALPLDKLSSATTIDPVPPPLHAAWLGCEWPTDAQQTGAILADLQPDWLVVDHYALGQQWEEALAPHYRKLLVIDDLADRPHCCDLLLDQNWFGDDTHTRYRNLVPPHCKCHLGPEYALLKSEYAQLRESMPLRDGTVRRVLVFLGGSDPTNQTSKVLEALMQPSFAHLQVDVVIGQNHPDIECVAAQAATRPGTTLHQSLPTLAPLMVRADLMISAGGSTTWERMCVGLPAVVISVAANQTSTNVALTNAGYIDFLGEMNEVSVSNIADAVRHSLANAATLKAQSSLGQKLVSGIGAQVVCQQILSG